MYCCTVDIPGRKAIPPLSEPPQKDPSLAIAVIGGLTFLLGLWTVYEGCRCVSSATHLSEVFFEPLSEECASAQSDALLVLEISSLFAIYVKCMLPPNVEED